MKKLFNDIFWFWVIVIIFYSIGLFYTRTLLAVPPCKCNQALVSFHQNISYSKPLTIANSTKQELAQVSCLAKNIYFEGRNEPKVGKIAIAYVVLNRVHDRRFPKSICKVVYQKGQFSWVNKHKHIKEHWVYKKCKAIAKATYMVYNKTLDPTYGAKFYHEKTLTGLHWHGKTVTIGNHVFYRRV
jgi:spore germination cell wall hydrolase CwlJ-like protein